MLVSVTLRIGGEDLIRAQVTGGRGGACCILTAAHDCNDAAVRTFASREIEEENSIGVDTKQNPVSSCRGISDKVVDSVRLWFEGMAWSLG